MADRSSPRPPAVWVDDLDIDVCWRLLASQPIGRLAFVVDGAPRVYPVNHRVVGRTIVFRTAHDAAVGELVGAAVAFEVDDADESAQTGWSVLVNGSLEEVTAPSEIAELAAADVHAWAPDKDRWVRIDPDAISGRAISRRRTDGTGELVPYRP